MRSMILLCPIVLGSFGVLQGAAVDGCVEVAEGARYVEISHSIMRKLIIPKNSAHVKAEANIIGK